MAALLWVRTTAAAALLDSPGRVHQHALAAGCHAVVYLIGRADSRASLTSHFLAARR